MERNVLQKIKYYLFWVIKRPNLNSLLLYCMITISNYNSFLLAFSIALIIICKKTLKIIEIIIIPI